MSPLENSNGALLETGCEIRRELLPRGELRVEDERLSTEHTKRETPNGSNPQHSISA